MTRAERRQLERDQKKADIKYNYTAKQIAELKENARNEVRAELTKQYDKKFAEYVQLYEGRVNDVMKVSTNRSLIYILGIGVEVLTKKFGFNKKQNHKWFDECRMRFNEAPDMLTQLAAIEQYSGWDVTPTLDEITYTKEDNDNE